MAKKPIIGITLDLTKDSEKYKYASFPWYALRKNYADSVLLAGGIPIMITHSHESIDTILELIDGLVIPGGDEDVNPKFYNQQIISSKVRTNDQRAGFELALTKSALERDIPLLGICGGMQVLNVSLGGNLIQHIPDYIQSEINHEQTPPKDIPTHPIIIKPATMLYKLSDCQDEVMVNSTHHQAVDRLGDGLIVSALAPDGIVEAIESLNHKFVIGVEWHPEYLNTNNLDLNLFKGLIDASN